MIEINSKVINGVTVQLVQYQPGDNPEFAGCNNICTFPDGTQKGFKLASQARIAALSATPPNAHQVAEPATPPNAAAPNITPAGQAFKPEPIKPPKAAKAAKPPKAGKKKK